MFKKFFELMARKIFKFDMSIRKRLMPKEDYKGMKKTMKASEKEYRAIKKKNKNIKEPLPQSLKDRLKSGKKLTDKELSELYGQSPKEFVQQNLDRGRRQRKSVKKYRADLDKGAGKWSPSRGISPDDPGVHNSPETLRKHLMNTPGASLVGAGTAASLTRKKKRKK